MSEPMSLDQAMRCPDDEWFRDWLDGWLAAFTKAMDEAEEYKTQKLTGGFARVGADGRWHEYATALELIEDVQRECQEIGA